jgi:LEA14-like dessication related protein
MLQRLGLAALMVCLAWMLAACASLTQRDAVQVQVVGVEPLPGEGLELRFAVKLRVQNPNDTPIDYDGLFIELDVRGSSFATGVSDAKGSVPRYGEEVLTIPVTVSAFSAARQVLGFYQGSYSKLDYQLKGKIGGPSFMPVRFEHKGELTLPSGM